jgi:pimeloyl-ACP methyl ester carboxylesterase
MIAVAKGLLSLLVVLVVAGVIYEQIGRRRDRTRYPQIGRSVDIGGRTLNISCSGEGSPAVIFDSGGHTAGFSWIDIQPEISKRTRACWYDRAGFGWSDPGPSPRTFQAIANDLHELLHAANVEPPYVLVGATAGTFHVRVYNKLYPDEVAGAVLIHASDPEAFTHEPQYMKGALASLPPILKKTSCRVLEPVMLNSGLLRLMGNPGSGRPEGIDYLNRDQQRELSFLSKNPETVRGGEGCDLEEGLDEVRAAGDFGGRPLVVLTSSRPFRAPGGGYAQETAALNDYWFHQLQPHLAALSSRGELVLVDDAQRPEAIIRAVNKVVGQVRGGETGH